MSRSPSFQYKNGTPRLLLRTLAMHDDYAPVVLWRARYETIFKRSVLSTTVSDNLKAFAEHGFAKREKVDGVFSYIITDKGVKASVAHGVIDAHNHR